MIIIYIRENQKNLIFERQTLDNNDVMTRNVNILKRMQIAYKCGDIWSQEVDKFTRPQTWCEQVNSQTIYSGIQTHGIQGKLHKKRFQ